MATTPTLQPAIEGFIQGYAQAEGKAATVTYLADDITGFNAPEKAYAAMTRLSWDAFVFPLAGGSASGIYKYVREEMFSGTDGAETARHMQAYKQENTLTTGKKPPEGTMIRPFFRTFAIRFK